jgi:RNA recognition motif-containing protein
MIAKSKRHARLFAGNLDYAVCERELRDIFAGEPCDVVSITIATDASTGRPLGRGWITVDLHPGTTVAALIEKINRLIIRGRPLHLDVSAPFRKALAPEQGTRLHIENLPYAIDAADLRWIFEGEGAHVVSVEISKNFRGESKGRAWVVISGKDDAKAVVAAVDGSICRTRRLRCGVATPPGIPRQPSDTGIARTQV